MTGVRSATLGAGGVALALPSGGSITVPAAVSAATGFAMSGTLITGGTLAISDAFSKVATANADLKISFANDYDSWQVTKPTSKTFGKKISGRVGNQKVDNIRVDAEPNSNKIQIQSGGGKSGYKVDEFLKVENIKGKKSIQDWVIKNKNLKDWAMEQKRILLIICGMRING